MATLVASAIRLQRCFRTWYAALVEADRLVAALLIQAAARGYLVRAENRDLSRGIEMVRILQCAMRQHLARKRFFKMIEMREQVAAAEILQEEWRSFRQRQGIAVKSSSASHPPRSTTSSTAQQPLNDRINLIERQLDTQPILEGWLHWQQGATTTSEKLWFEVAATPFFGEEATASMTVARYLVAERAGELQVEINLLNVQALHFNPPQISISTVGEKQYLFSALTGSGALHWAEGKAADLCNAGGSFAPSWLF